MGYGFDLLIFKVEFSRYMPVWNNWQEQGKKNLKHCILLFIQLLPRERRWYNKTWLIV
jgi:hypothetical protein